MFSLIKVEFFKLKRRDKYLAIAITCLIISMLMIPVVKENRIHNWRQVIDFNFRSITFVTSIFLCILLSELFITEYKEKTINVMLSYPVSRTKIYIAKMVVVFSYCFFIVIQNSLFSTGIIVILNTIKPIIKDSIDLSIIIEGAMTTLVSIAVNTMFAVLYSFFAIVKRSFLLMAIFCTLMSTLQGTLQALYPFFYFRIPLVLGGISVLAAIPILYTLNSKDVICDDGK